MQVEIHAAIKPPEWQISIDPQIPDEILAPIGEPLTPTYPISGQSVAPKPIENKRKQVVPDLQQLPMSPLKTY